jgi:hypothetical protein
MLFGGLQEYFETLDPVQDFPARQSGRLEKLEKDVVGAGKG